MEETEKFVDYALNLWREKRDALFALRGLDKDKVYADGDFQNLPADCLMAVCYVDAYACVQAKIRSRTE